jgi:hypothetical protein
MSLSCHVEVELKYNGSPCRLTDSGVRDVETGRFIPAGALVDLCAWCDKGKVVTKRLKQLGYEITHGVCQKCKLAFLAEAKPTYDQMVETRSLAERLAEQLGCRQQNLALRCFYQSLTRRKS